MNRRSTHPFQPRRRRRGTVLLAVLATVAGLVGWVQVSADASASRHDPRGALESVRLVPTGVQVTGWALDLDTKGSIAVGISVNGTTRVSTTANVFRLDVAKAYLGYGANHGFDKTVALAPGTYRVCAWARNVGDGRNSVLGCKQALVTWNPRGGLDSVTVARGTVSVKGAAVDVNATAPISVDVFSDGTKLGRLTAGAALHSGHGYVGTFPFPQGTHTVCVTGINVGPGQDTQLGCRTVTLDESPRGQIDYLTQVPNGVRVTGFVVDPDTTDPVTARISIDGSTVGTVTAGGPAHGGHSFGATYTVKASGRHTVCLTGVNVSFGSNRVVECQAVDLRFDPTIAMDTLVQKSPGFTVTGWAADPDTANPVTVRISADGTLLGTVTANGTGTTHSGHRFTASYALAAGKHTVCVSAVNVGSGANSAGLCKAITLNFDPFGRVNSTTRVSGSTDIQVGGWAIDPDTTKPISVRITRDGTLVSTVVAGQSRTDVQATYPAYGALHGYAVRVPADDQEHKICAVGVNVAKGADRSLGCRIINAVDPVPPTVPGSVTAVPDYGSATVTWTAPTSDGGAPWSSYVVVSSPGGITVKVGPTATTAEVTGLKPGVAYTFAVTAVNVAGSSPAGVSPKVTTPVGPPPQTTPAPISTSRYIRNITGASSTDLAKLRAAGVADAKANPSGHRYLMLLDIGGQDQYYGGVILSATTRFISYSALLANMKAYVDGYASAQKPSAPAHITVGTNNDIDVTYAAGVAWAQKIVNPLRSYAAKYRGIEISGANDVEPGFRGSYTATKSWLSGYLSATTAKFVFNGSADGCAWTVTNRACNNGWSMAGLYNLAGGMAPTRTINLPQIYNNTMAAQWKYISLTGVQAGKPRINFGGPLTEWTACAQARSCGSLTGNYAWTRMWNELQSHPALKVSSLPYSTDLRIDR